MLRAYVGEIGLSIANIHGQVALYKPYLDDEKPSTHGINPKTKNPTAILTFDTESVKKFIENPSSTEAQIQLANAYLENPRANALKGYKYFTVEKDESGEDKTIEKWILLPSSKALKNLARASENLQDGLQITHIVKSSDVDDHLLSGDKYLIKSRKVKGKRDISLDHKLEVFALAMAEKNLCMFGKGFLRDSLKYFIIRPYTSSQRNMIPDAIFLQIDILNTKNTLKDLEDLATPCTAKKEEVDVWSKVLESQIAEFPLEALVDKEAELIEKYISNPIPEEELLNLKAPETVPEINFGTDDFIGMANGFSLGKSELKATV
jgi:hypothetical protein